MFFGLPESEGFLLAGGAALVAQRLTNRPTRDLDLFSAPGTALVTAARDAIEVAATRRGWKVERVSDAETFCRLQITGLGEIQTVDLAIDVAPTQATILTGLGPSFAPEELAGRKTLALFDRAEARDFTDVHRLAQLFGRETLLARAAEVDNGFDPYVLASMMRTLDRFTDDEIPVDGIDVSALRNYFRDWARELDTA